jgi:hypothetical protein
MPGRQSYVPVNDDERGRRKRGHQARRRKMKDLGYEIIELLIEYASVVGDHLAFLT